MLGLQVIINMFNSFNYPQIGGSMKNTNRQIISLMALIVTLTIGLFSSNAFSAIKAGTASFDSASEVTSDFLAVPPFLEKAMGKPSVILAFDVSGSMLVPAYPQNGVSWSDGTHTNFNADQTYYGYFESGSQYQYDDTDHLFVPSSLSKGSPGAWDGDFLNWLTMRRVDVARKVMIGGKVRDRNGETINGSKKYVLEAEKEIRTKDDYTKKYDLSSTVSDIPDGLDINIAEGKIKVPALGGDSTSSKMAVSPVDGYNIQLALDEEPKGIVQDNTSTFNFGLSVYNFDHRTNKLNGIVKGNQVNGGTMHPCYPIFDQERWDRRVTEDAADNYMEIIPYTLYNSSTRDYLCIPTSVHAPNDKIVQVIEEYPLIWGSTPIAESLVDIGRYVRQEAPQYIEASTDSSYNKKVGNNPNGVHGIDSTGSNVVNILWDPYYDVEQAQKLECKKVFVLHFNDGAPYTDYNGVASKHSFLNKDLVTYTGDTGGYGENEALDNVALALRQNDCREDAGMAGHQEIISYFVYAALGEDEQENTSTRRMREAAAMGGFKDSKDDDGLFNNTPDPIRPKISGSEVNFNDYYASNSTPGVSNPTDCPENEWDSNSDCEPDTFFLALDGSEIGPKIQAALNDMEARISSGGAASVVSTTASGEGVLYQASFTPTLSEGSDTVEWLGDVSGLMIDSQGYIRSDDGDANLEDFDNDPIYDSCYDEVDKVVRVKFSTTEDSRPSEIEAQNCTTTVFNKSLDDVGYIWSGQEFLYSLTNSEVKEQRSAYGAGEKNRFIRTNLQATNSNVVNEVSFEEGIFTSEYVGLLNTSSEVEADSLVNFIRGVDQAGMRSRQLNGKTMRLGDVIYSTPVPVGRPSESLHILYDDQSYLDFFQKYRTRRTVVYVGGNDGMLHSFNGGWYNKQESKFETQKTGYAEWELGQELWGFVPYNLLPHLKYLSNPDYGTKDGDHVYFMDQTPYIFDAKIFGSGGATGQAGTDTHPNGWGTVMVVGFRTGGGVAEVYPNPTDLSKSVTVRPSYLIFDVTDPEQAPKLLAEFSHEKLGQTMSVPTALTVKNISDGIDWYLALGSGPTANAIGNNQAMSEQNAHLFMLNLKTMNLEPNFGSAGVMDLGEANSFVGDIVAVDYNLDVHTDALYFGTTQSIDNAVADGIIDDWKGKLFRLRVNPGSAAGSHSWKTNEMLDLQSPILNRPQVSIDHNKNRWIHVGTGRFLTIEDTVDLSAGVLVGVKEPRAIDGTFDMDTYSNNGSVIPLNSLIDVSNSDVSEDSGNLNNSISVSPALDSDTIEAFEARQMQYSNATNLTKGWRRTLGTGEKAMGAGTIFGSFYTQTSYIPDTEACSVIGESYLNAMRYTTGTAWYKHVFPDSDPNDDGTIVDDKKLIGKTPTLSPGIHVGESRQDGEAKFINLNSDMSLSITTESNLEGIDSKDTSWREIK